ncbi:MAG TPA: hypothetical protein VII49_11965 [Rhizomicrobium sp.]
MSDDFEDDIAKSSVGSAALASGIAMGGATDGGESREYLREQIALTRLQKQNLIEQNDFELSHLRWRRFNDRMMGALQVLLVALGALIVSGFAFMVWNAADSGGLVIEQFSVPPDLVARGVTGQVVASKLLDRLAAMEAQTDSQRDPQTFANFWGDDIKVQIPETGISLGELDRYLREMLGHPTQITGEIVRNANGLSLTARAGTEGNGTVSGPDADIDALVQKLAESIYGITQPYRYGIWLREHDRNGEGIAVFIALAKSGPPNERPWGYLGWGNSLEESTSISARLAMMRKILTISDLYLARQNIALIEDEASHPEAALRDFRSIVPMLSAASHGDIRANVVPIAEKRLQSFINLNLGAFHEAVPLWEAEIEFGPQGVNYNMHAMLTRTELGEHDLSAARATIADSAEPGGINTHNGSLDIVTARMMIDIEAQDWAAVLAEYRAAGALFALDPGLRTIAPSTELPFLAYADARLGDFEAADALIAQTPAGCYRCLIFRARIVELQGQHARADWWFVRAVTQAPSIPFAYSEWGALLLSRGQYDAAIAKFKSANQKGPHFADPLEMWAEALMQKNRSDLALAKFEEADTYAPNWGRLHLKWGEALLYAGHKDAARKQFAVATRLDLTAADKAALTRVGTMLR